MAIINYDKDNKLLSGTNGDDTIKNGGYWHGYWYGGGSYVTINGKAGNDSIYNGDDAYDSYINGGSGNDFINNDGAESTIIGGSGNDSIHNSMAGENLFINGGSGKDSIENYGDGVIIIGGIGNDIICNGYDIENDNYYDGSENVLFKYSSGDGNDIIYGFKADSTLSISGGSYSSKKSGDDIIVTVGDGKISLIGAATLSSVNIIGTKGSSDNATLLTVTDSTKSPLTVGSAVKTVNATARTKAIKITGNKLANSIVGGKGADTLNGGKGNDTLTGGDGNDIFIYSAGNDLITDYATGDKISISSAISKATVSGNDVVFTIGSGKLTVKGGKQKTLTLINSAGVESQTVIGAATTSTLLTVTNSTSSPVTVGSAVKTINASSRTKAVQITGNKLANSINGGSKNDSLYGSNGNDTILGNAGNDKLYGQNGNDLLKGGVGNDSLAGGAGNDTLTGGDGNDVFIYSAGNDLITDFAVGDTLSISSGTVSEVTASGDNLIFTIGKGKITVKGGANETVTYYDSDGEHIYPNTDTSSEVSISSKTIKLLEDYTEESFNVDDYGKTLQNIDASGVLLDMEITGNKLRNSILGGANNETLIGGKGNDILTGGDGADVFVYSMGDGQDTINDYNADDLISIGAGTISDISVSGKDVIFKVGSGKITVKNAKNKVISYIDANGNPATYPQTVIISGTTARLTESYMNDSFNAADYNSSLRTIDATAVLHDVEIIGNKLANSIIGSENNETISGGKGNDTLTGGEGSDIFLYAKGDGNDVITDYAEEDKISIASGTISTIKTSGSNVIFTVGSNKITVAGAASKTVTYIDKDGKIKYFPKKPSSDIILTDNKTTAILRETYSDSTYTAKNSIEKIDAFAVQHNLSITGNGKANVILGGYGDDTIYGGKGNDTLQGGSGFDVFVYANGDEKDLILDYKEEDTIQITKGKAKVSTKGDDVIFTIGSGKITVLGAANKTVSYIESGKTKTYGSSALFIVDDNDYELTPNLSTIVQNKSVDYSFLNTSTEFTRENNLIAYAKEK
ncbi:MAG: hypothetical protein IKT98_05350 [Selenomonadaceae bacterium]|nr:hypothetical protein [Selenomonadaceae bacterium]